MPLASLYNNILSLGSISEEERNTKLRWLKEGFEASSRRMQDALLEGMVEHLWDTKPPLTRELAAGLGRWVETLSLLQMANLMHAFRTGGRRGRDTHWNGVRPSGEDEKYNARLQQCLSLDKRYANAIRALMKLLERVEDGCPSVTEEDCEVARILGRFPA